ncbi:lithostathine-1-beta-like [Diadema setosum]|uniref:lithostathine-1-beta-like n=1 Tax=Diadema setosum TaxID=31175 RepID=UPI003B3AFED6
MVSEMSPRRLLSCGHVSETRFVSKTSPQPGRDSCSSTELVCPGIESSSSVSCYLYRQDSQTWVVARDKCHELGGYLVAVETTGEMSSLVEVALISDPEFSMIFFWTGLNDRSSEGVYTWETVGGTFSSSDSLCESGEPNPQKADAEDCADLNLYPELTRTLIHDAECSLKQPYICEFQP